MENMAEKGQVEKQRKDANMLKEQQESLERRVTLLERAGPTGGVGGASKCLLINVDFIVSQ